MNANVKLGIFMLIQIVNFLVFARVILSWITSDYRNPIFKFLHEVTEPILAPIRSLLSALGLGGQRIDFSPIVLVLLLSMIGSFISGL